MNSGKFIITIATGKKVYIDMAVNLARSFLWWHPETDIKFQLVTDMEERVPLDIKKRIQIISIKTGEHGRGFYPKLSLDLLASPGQTIFIDSDCLIFTKLDPLFERFRGHAVSVVGGYISEGEWFGNVASICKNFNVPHYPKFNGGLYYLEKGALASKVFETARDLEKQYDDIGFVRYRDYPADEVLMALAMQLNGQQPVEDDGTIMSDFQSCQGRPDINVIEGKSILSNPEYPDPKHQNWYPFTKVSPIIVHFLGHHTQNYPYKREAFRVHKALRGKSRVLTALACSILIELPMAVKIETKNVFRPLFRLMIGTRTVKPSERV